MPGRGRDARFRIRLRHPNVTDIWRKTELNYHLAAICFTHAPLRAPRSLALIQLRAFEHRSESSTTLSIVFCYITQCGYRQTMGMNTRLNFQI